MFTQAMSFTVKNFSRLAIPESFLVPVMHPVDYTMHDTPTAGRSKKVVADGFLPNNFPTAFTMKRFGFEIYGAFAAHA